MDSRQWCRDATGAEKPRACAKVELEPESWITEKGERRAAEKVCMSGVVKRRQGDERRERGRTGIPQMVSWSAQFTSTWLLEEGPLPWWATSKPAWRQSSSIRASHIFPEGSPTIVCFKAPAADQLKSQSKNNSLYLKLGHGSNRETDTPLDNLFLCNGLALSLSLPPFVHAPKVPILLIAAIRICQWSILTQNPREH